MRVIRGYIIIHWLNCQFEICIISRIGNLVFQSLIVFLSLVRFISNFHMYVSRFLFCFHSHSRVPLDHFDWGGGGGLKMWLDNFVVQNVLIRISRLGVKQRWWIVNAGYSNWNWRSCPANFSWYQASTISLWATVNLVFHVPILPVQNGKNKQITEWEIQICIHNVIIANGLFFQGLGDPDFNFQARKFREGANVLILYQSYNRILSTE